VVTDDRARLALGRNEDEHSVPVASLLHSELAEDTPGGRERIRLRSPGHTQPDLARCRALRLSDRVDDPRFIQTSEKFLMPHASPTFESPAAARPAAPREAAPAGETSAETSTAE